MWSGGDIASVLTAASLVITAVTSLISVLIGIRNSRQIEVVRQATNGLKDELVGTARDLGHSAGVAEGRKEGREAQRADDKVDRVDAAAAEAVIVVAEAEAAAKKLPTTTVKP